MADVEIVEDFPDSVGNVVLSVANFLGVHSFREALVPRLLVFLRVVLLEIPPTLSVVGDILVGLRLRLLIVGALVHSIAGAVDLRRPLPPIAALRDPIASTQPPKAKPGWVVECRAVGPVVRLLQLSIPIRLSVPENLAAVAPPGPCVALLFPLLFPLLFALRRIQLRFLLDPNLHLLHVQRDHPHPRSQGDLFDLLSWHGDFG